MDVVAPHYLDSLTAIVQRIVDESGDPVGFDAHASTIGWIHSQHRH